MTIRAFEGVSPVIDPSAYIDETALVIGHVTIGRNVSIWPMSVVRGDEQPITIGDNTNIQDACVIHITHDHPRVPGGLATMIGSNVTVGHRVTLHACTIGNNCLIGMSATIMDGAVVEDDVVIAAGSLVTPGKVLESGYLYAGSPARRGRALEAEELAFLPYSAEHYVALKNRHAQPDKT